MRTGRRRRSSRIRSFLAEYALTTVRRSPPDVLDLGNNVDPRGGPGRAAPVGRVERGPGAFGPRRWPGSRPGTSTNIRQVTSGFARAGEGYFSPDGQSIIFQAVPHLPPSIFHQPKPDEDGYQIYPGPAQGGRAGPDGQHGQGAVHLPLLPPERQVDPVRLDPPEPQHGGRAAQGAGLQPDRRAIAGSSPSRWTSSPPISTARTSVRLTDTPGYDAEGSYSPDGSQIVFTSFRDGDGEIYIMDADGKNPRRITRRQGLRRRPVLLARRQADHLPQRPQGERPASGLCQQHRGHGRAGPDQQRVRQLGAVLASRQPPHHLRDQQARPRELRALLDGRGQRPARSGSPTTKASTACRSSAPTASG